MDVKLTAVAADLVFYQAKHHEARQKRDAPKKPDGPKMEGGQDADNAVQQYI